MKLTSLRVLHRPKRGAPRASVALEVPVPSSSDWSFRLKTCQRSVVVTLAERCGRLKVDDAEWLEGTAAYGFLLELAAGLKSTLVGEGEILGQIKTAWTALERCGGPLVAELGPWMQGVLADAKEVREQYLRGTGGQSYGSLLRHVLGGVPTGPILLIGAGQLAADVLPYLAAPRGGAQTLRLCNRTRAHAERLREQLRARVAAPIEIVADGLAAELEAWSDAALVVLCIPADPLRDGARVAAALQRPPSARPRVVHLGLLDTEGSAWSGLSAALTLESLFAVDRRQTALRAERITLAREWCRARARLRALDRCVSIAHGWEDLAGFALGGAAC